MIVEELTAERTNLIMQRSVAKDQIEALERRLGVVAYTLAAFEEKAKQDAEVEAKISKDVLADVLKFPVNDDAAPDETSEEEKEVIDIAEETSVYEPTPADDDDTRD